MGEAAKDLVRELEYLREEVASVWALTARLADRVEQLHIRLNPVSIGRRDDEDDGGD